MKVLVTGVAGFVGRYLVEKPALAGHPVVGLDNLGKYGPGEIPFGPRPNCNLVKGSLVFQRGGARQQ